MDGTALIEMLRSMSQAGYSSGASLGNGPVAPHQQQQQDPVSDAMVLPAEHIVQHPASMAPAQPDASAPATHAPAGVQPTEAEPAQHTALAMMDSNAVPHAASGAQPEQGTEEGRGPAGISMPAGVQVPEPEQPAEAMSAAPSQQATEAARLLQQQKEAVDAPSVPEAAAPSELLPEAQAPAEQPESAAPPAGLEEQPVMPDRAMQGTAAPAPVQQAEDAALSKPSAKPAEAPDNANHVQDSQDTIMHDAGEADASQGQAADAELPAMAEPVKPAAANHVEAGVAHAVGHAVSHGSADGKQPALLQQATSASTAGAEPGAESHHALAETVAEKLLTAQDGSALPKLQPEGPAQSTALAKPAVIASSGPDMLKSIADVSRKPFDVAAAVEHDDHGAVSTAELLAQETGAAMDIDDRGDFQTLANHATHTGAEAGSPAVQAPEDHLSDKKEAPRLSMTQKEPRSADDSCAAAAGGGGGMSSMQSADGQM